MFHTPEKKTIDRSPAVFAKTQPRPAPNQRHSNALYRQMRQICCSVERRFFADSMTRTSVLRTKTDKTLILVFFETSPDPPRRCGRTRCARRTGRATADSESRSTARSSRRGTRGLRTLSEKCFSRSRLTRQRQVLVPLRQRQQLHDDEDEEQHRMNDEGDSSLSQESLRTRGVFLVHSFVLTSLLCQKARAASSHSTLRMARVTRNSNGEEVKRYLLRRRGPCPTLMTEGCIGELTSVSSTLRSFLPSKKARETSVTLVSRSRIVMSFTRRALIFRC